MTNAISSIETKEFQKQLYTINTNKYSKHKSAVLQLSTDFPDVHIVAWFSYDGDTLKKVSAYKKYGEAKFNADRGNGWIIKAGEML